MAEEKKYLVRGKFHEKNIEETVMALSDKQAKFKTAMKNGIRGQNLTAFMRSSNIRVVRRI